MGPAARSAPARSVLGCEQRHCGDQRDAPRCSQSDRNQFGDAEIKKKIPITYVEENEDYPLSSL